MRPPKATPWGASDYEHEIAEGVWVVHTASHGGYWLSAERQAAMPYTLRLTKGGWYEEDCEWARVALALPDLFPTHAAKPAEEMLRAYSPDSWEAFYGRKLKPGESHARDQETFYRQHAGDMIAFSAVNSKLHPGYVEVYARIGGRNGKGDEARYLVARDRYRDSSGPAYLIQPGDKINHDAPRGGEGPS